MAIPKTKYFARLQAVDPKVPGDTVEVCITPHRAKYIISCGVELVQDMFDILPEVLSEPRAIYTGVRWEEYDADESVDNWLCYVGAPRQRYRGKMQPVRPVSPGDLFLVFVNGEWVAYNWRWEKPDPETGLPAQADIRFFERLR